MINLLAHVEDALIEAFEAGYAARADYVERPAALRAYLTKWRLCGSQAERESADKTQPPPKKD
jgi:hypothetical protein